MFFFVVTTLVGFNDAIDLDDMVNEVQTNILGLEGCKEQSQINFLDNGLGNLEELQLAMKICTSVDVV